MEFPCLLMYVERMFSGHTEYYWGRKKLHQHKILEFLFLNIFFNYFMVINLIWRGKSVTKAFQLGQTKCSNSEKNISRSDSVRRDLLDFSYYWNGDPIWLNSRCGSLLFTSVEVHVASFLNLCLSLEYARKA